jgi:hypothetical protein
MDKTIEESIEQEKVEKSSDLVFPSQDFLKSAGASSTRGMVFETEKQRNTQFIKKGITKPGMISYEVLRRAVNSVHIARICVNTLKEKITKTNWVIQPLDPAARKKVGGDMDKRIKEVTELFKHPNKGNETFRTLLDKILEDLLVLDSVSIEKTRFPDGKLAELHFVDSATIRPVFDEFGNQDIEIPLHTTAGTEILPVSYVQVMNNSQYGGPASGEIVAAWPKKDFLHFHMHPQGSMEGIGYGLSPIEAVLSVVANILNADNYNGTYFEEGSFPPVIIQILGQVGQRDIEAYREYMYSELTGNFHRPAIMAGGNEAKVLNLKDLSNNDMQFMEYMKFLARLLAAAYGLSGQDIGLTEDVGSKNVSETQKEISNAKGYGSILHLLKEVFNQEIIWKDFGYQDIEFEWAEQDTLDVKDAIDTYDKGLRAGIYTLNEVRQKLGELPYEEWADEPMILGADGYKALKLIENDAMEIDDEIGGEKPYNEQKDDLKKSMTKSVMTSDGYRTWMDDRGYGQPFIFEQILSGLGYAIKPPVAVNVNGLVLEENLTNELANKGINVNPVERKTYNEVVKMLPASVLGEFKSYVNMEEAYDSEKWRGKFGGSRKYPYYMVSSYIDGLPLNNPILLADMKRDPDSYKKAIEDLAELWKTEKEMVLGDRRADQYIITPDKRAYGIDYQFKGDYDRWKNTSQSIQNALNACPDLKVYFESKLAHKKSMVKNFISKFAVGNGKK